MRIIHAQGGWRSGLTAGGWLLAVTVSTITGVALGRADAHREALRGYATTSELLAQAQVYAVQDGLRLGAIAAAGLLVAMSGRRLLGLLVPLGAALGLGTTTLGPTPFGSALWLRAPADGTGSRCLWGAAALGALLALLPIVTYLTLGGGRTIARVGLPRLAIRLYLPLAVVVAGGLIQRAWGQGDPYHPQLACVAVLLAGLVATGPQSRRMRLGMLALLLASSDQVLWRVGQLLTGHLTESVRALDLGQLLTTGIVLGAAAACSTLGRRIPDAAAAGWVRVFRAQPGERSAASV